MKFAVINPITGLARLVESYKQITSLESIEPIAIDELEIRQRGYDVFRGTLEAFERRFAIVDKVGDSDFETAYVERKLERLSTRIKSANTRLKNVNDELKRRISDLRTVKGISAEMPSHKFARSIKDLRDSKAIPSKSGCYCAWDGELCQYVGRAKCLRSRLTKAHHVLDESSMVTWCLMDVEFLYFAEAYFIGVLQPSRNIAKPQRHHLD